MTDQAFDSVPDWAKLQAATAPTEKRSMPTDKQLESIARRYCELMGQDPDMVVHSSSPGCHPGIYDYQTRAQMALPIVRQHAALSIAFGGQ